MAELMILQAEASSTQEELERGMAPLYNRSLLQLTEREFPVSIYKPTFEELHKAAPPDLRSVVEQFPLCKDGDIELVLDELGIAVIVDIDENGPQSTRISWSAATTDAWAQDQLKQFSRPDYRTLRQGLNIDYHWIFRTNSDYWNYEDEDLIEKTPAFEEWCLNECWIFDPRPMSIRSSK